MNRGRGEETFLKKGFLSLPEPSLLLPKTFDFIESCSENGDTWEFSSFLVVKKRSVLETFFLKAHYF